jgi:hypothetical protein
MQRILASHYEPKTKQLLEETLECQIQISLTLGWLSSATDELSRLNICHQIGQSTNNSTFNLKKHRKYFGKWRANPWNSGKLVQQYSSPAHTWFQSENFQLQGKCRRSSAIHIHHVLLRETFSFSQKLQVHSKETIFIQPKPYIRKRQSSLKSLTKILKKCFEA